MRKRKERMKLKNGSITFETEAGKTEKVSNEVDITVLGEKTNTIQKVTILIVSVVLLCSFRTTKNPIVHIVRAKSANDRRTEPPKGIKQKACGCSDSCSP